MLLGEPHELSTLCFSLQHFLPPTPDINVRHVLVTGWSSIKSYWHAAAQSLMKFLARVLRVVQEELARRELVAVDGFELPHLLHQLVGTKGVHKTERPCKQ